MTLFEAFLSAPLSLDVRILEGVGKIITYAIVGNVYTNHLTSVQCVITIVTLPSTTMPKTKLVLPLSMTNDDNGIWFIYWGDGVEGMEKLSSNIKIWS